ncbi:MAG TPA: glycosyltransferase family 4 protein [Candidatus Acidoferrum sp.]|nr:glycosyltransferase family 4 protein [Candidatus Acidoferrum sp.]
MRILFLNLYFPPDTSATAKSAESMVHALAQAHEVTVLCGRPSYDPTERRPWKLWQTELLSSKIGQSSGEAAGQPAAFTVIRVGSTDYPRIQMNRRILNYLTYVKLGAARAFFIPCDVIFAMTDPPFNGIVAALLSVLKRKPLLYDIQDMYPDMAVAGAVVQPGLFTRLWERLHRWALRRATRIIVLGDDMRARVIAKGPQGPKGIDPAKVFIVRSGADTHLASSNALPLNSEVTRAIRGNFRFVLLHAGNLGFYGAWDTIIAAAHQLGKENIGFVFVGDGAERSRLESLAANATNVRFLPFFPSSEIPSVLAAPDAHIVTIKRGLEGVVVPSKMFGIIAAGKPIVAVAAPETDVAALGARHGFAICADPTSPDELASSIRRLAADPPALASMRQAALKAAAQYSRASQLKTLTGIFEHLGRRS